MGEPEPVKTLNGRTKTIQNNVMAEYNGGTKTRQNNVMAEPEAVKTM